MSINMSNVKAITLGGRNVKKIEDTNGNVLWKEVPVVSLDYINISGYKTRLHTGDSFVFGGTVTAHYTDGTNAEVTSNATFSGYDMSTVGTYNVIVSYTENGVTRTTSYSLVVADITTDTINITIGSGQDITTTQYYNRIVFPSISNIRSKVANKIGASSSDVSLTKIELSETSLYWFNNTTINTASCFSLTTSNPKYFGRSKASGTGIKHWGTINLDITDKLSSSATTSFYGYVYKNSGSYESFSTSTSYPHFCKSSGANTKPTFTILVSYEY